MYKCFNCGAKMKLEGDVLVCPECGHSVDLEDYSTEAEDYEEFYWNVIGTPVEDSNDNEEFPGEPYDDIYDE